MDTYKGYDVLIPSIRKGTSFSVNSSLMVNGSLQNARTSYYNKPGSMVLSTTLLQDNVDERIELLDFFKSKKGKLIPFWLRTPMELAVIIDTVTPGLVYRIKNVSLTSVLDSVKVFVYIERTQTYAEITSSVPGSSITYGAYEEITFDTEIGAIVGDSLLRVYFVRFGQDSLYFKQNTFSSSAVSISFKELQIEQE